MSIHHHHHMYQYSNNSIIMNVTLTMHVLVNTPGNVCVSYGDLHPIVYDTCRCHIHLRADVYDTCAQVL